MNKVRLVKSGGIVSVRGGFRRKDDYFPERFMNEVSYCPEGL
jgi:hypothetical protein